MTADHAPLTLAEKIWRAHHIADLASGARLVAIDRLLLHERTGGVALQSLEAAGREVLAPAQVFATMDHIVDTTEGRSDDTRMPTGRDFIVATREGAHRHGITLFDLDDPRQGIVHVISPEQGIVLPGLTLVCPDSHTCTQGAFGALAWGIGSSEAEQVLATMSLRMNRPGDMRITIEGALGEGVSAKDLALALLAELGSGGATGLMLEFAGPAVEALDMEGRMTLCNMATEMAAAGAVIAPDDKTFDYLKGRPYAPRGDVWDRAVAAWRDLATDPGASFAKDVRFDAAAVRPMVTWGTSPQDAVPIGRTIPEGDRVERRKLDYMDVRQGAQVEGLAIDAAFIGSCTNSRISDLRRAANILRGRKVAPGVNAICVPGSMQVKAQAEAEGLDRIFKDAGFQWRNAGCSMCFFAGGESFGAHERVVSSTNRNFESRQGPNTRTHLASPETVAASAIAGRIIAASALEKA